MTAATTSTEAVRPDSPFRRPGRLAQVRSRLLDVVPPILLVVCLVLLWQAAVVFEFVSPILLPRPGEVATQIWEMAGNIAEGGFVREALLITAQEIGYGFAIAAVIGILLGYVIADSKIGRQAVMPLLVAINSVPKVALAPVFVAWLGFGMSSKIVMAAFISFFPVVVATAAGFKATDESALDLFRANQASRLKTVLKLKLPSAVPFIIAGLRTAAVFAVVGAVIGEFLGGSGGLGELVRQASNNLDMDRVFGYIFYLSLLGMAMYLLVSLIERRIASWSGSSQKRGGGL